MGWCGAFEKPNTPAPHFRELILLVPPLAFALEIVHFGAYTFVPFGLNNRRRYRSTLDASGMLGR
jgi:hypothetical protein